MSKKTNSSIWKKAALANFFVFILNHDEARRDSHEVAFEKNQVTADSSEYPGD